MMTQNQKDTQDKTYLEYIDSTKNISKFWEITVEEKKFSVYFGRIGTKGFVKEKEFSSSEAAIKDAEKMIASKIKKGYRKR